MTRTCANCEFWHATDSVLEGQCRRNAPAAGNCWPSTQSTDWCGEHRPRGSRPHALSVRARSYLGEDC